MIFGQINFRLRVKDWGARDRLVTRGRVRWSRGPTRAPFPPKIDKLQSSSLLRKLILELSQLEKLKSDRLDES